MLLFSPPSLTASQRGVEAGSDDHSLMCCYWFISVVYSKTKQQRSSFLLLTALTPLIDPAMPFLIHFVSLGLGILHCMSFLQEDCSHALCSMG